MKNNAYARAMLYLDAWKRFASRLPATQDPNKCWEWTGFRNNDGYGMIGAFGESRWLAHRLAWLFAFGDIPSGQCVLHNCDNPPCCNPAHLFLGTRDDNNKDRARKGRSAPGDVSRLRGIVYPTGSHSATAKLSADTVTKIRKMHSTGKYTQEEIAQQMGTTQTNVSLIVRWRNWKHLGGQP